MGQPFADWPPDDKILSLFRDWIVAQNERTRLRGAAIGAYVLSKISLDREADGAVRRSIGNGPRKLVDVSARRVEFGLFRCVVVGVCRGFVVANFVSKFAENPRFVLVLDDCAGRIKRLKPA